MRTDRELHPEPAERPRLRPSPAKDRTAPVPTGTKEKTGIRRFFPWLSTSSVFALLDNEEKTSYHALF
ncbi:MAG: hypothetical protein GX073_05125 [Firmicutes bacterium]|nr:hypothetical protein [Bacillota bacterium]